MKRTCSLFTFLVALVIHTSTASALSFMGLEQTVIGISGDGRVVFNSTSRWTADGGWETWESYTGGAVTGDVSVVSYDGSVVAGSTGDTAFHWSASTGISLGSLPGYEFYIVNDISADGSMVVGTAGGEEAFRWAIGSDMMGLGSISQANGVSSDASVITGAIITDVFPYVPTAAYWTEDSDWIVLRDPIWAGDYALDVADDGTILINPNYWRWFHPWLWSPDTGFSDIPDFDGTDTGFTNFASNISDDGSTVVGKYFAWCDNCYWSWIWDDANGIRFIDDILIAEGIDLSDWAYLFSAESISADGLLIVGNGRSTDGIFQGWILNLATLVTIDINPGKVPNIINLKSGGFVPVAILTEGEFDALQVNPASTMFGPEDAASTRYRVKDIDKDGDVDLILYFRIQQAGIACSDSQATLAGELYDGTPFTGTDTVQTKNCQ